MDIELNLLSHLKKLLIINEKYKLSIFTTVYYYFILISVFQLFPRLIIKKKVMLKNIALLT
jgi:hypothetical protein